MARVVDHLSVAELQAGYRGGGDATLARLSIPDQKGPMHRRDSGQWFGSGARLGVSARHKADARQGALAAGQS